MRLLLTLALPASLAFSVAAVPAPPDETLSRHEEVLRQIRKNSIDASAVYKVRELTLAREDVRFYFTEGVLAFLEPLEGRVTGALFVGEGELLLIPPDAAEKRNLARFTGAPVLNEKLSSAYLRFTDDTAKRLLEGLRRGEGQERLSGSEFAEQWDPVVQNLNLIYDLRLLADLLAAQPPAPFFAARVFGQRLGAFDISVDFSLLEQVIVGQTNWKDGRRYLDLWCAFAARAVRTGATPPPEDPVRPTAYRMESTIQPTRELEVSADMEFEALASGERVLMLELSRFLRLTSVESAGRALPYVQSVMKDESDARRRGNDLVAIILPEPLEKGRRYRLQFRYSGEVISDAGHGVLFVGARGSWYPNRGFTPAQFDLTFRFPRRLRLVSTGERLEQREEGDWRISRWKSREPIRVAGFNIGDYEEAQVKGAAGTVVEVYANRALELALEAQRRPTLLVDPSAPVPGPPGRRRAPLVSLPPPPPSPSMVAGQIARDTAHTLDFFIRTFGPLPFGRVAISPIPGAFAQGWPGLVYLSTLSFSVPFDAARRPLPQTTDLFYRTLLRDHELAHQWWGHVVVPAGYRDEWITEGMASYAALLALENQSRAGPGQMRLILDRHRRELLAKEGEETAEAAGPPALGFRLASSKSPDGAAVILYKKAPWIIHMLRGLMRDPRTGSDAAFFKFLRAAREEFSTRPVTTAGFRALAEKFVLPELNAESGTSLEWFFDQWVGGTGIPEIRLKASVKAPRGGAAKGGRSQVSGTVTLQGVDESWLLPVPIYAQTPRGEVFVGSATASTEESKFHFPLAAASQSAVADPRQTLLAVWKNP